MEIWEIKLTDFYKEMYATDKKYNQKSNQNQW